MHPRDYQLPYLETFSKAAELTSFTAAAKALQLTQAAVSQRVQALEKTLDTPLFSRRGGRVVLTEAGRKLYDFAQRILELHQEARRAVTGHDVPVAGDLLLAASSIPGEHLLPALLTEFGHKHPQIRVRATITDSANAIGQVERGEASVGLVGNRFQNPHLEFGLFASDRMVAVVPPNHDLAKRNHVSVDQLLKLPLILREAGSGLRQCFEQALGAAGKNVAALQVALELGSNEAIKKAVLQGAGIAILSTYAIQTESEAGRLKGLRVDGLICDRDMFFVYDKRRAVPPAARRFLHFLESHPVASDRG